MPTPPASTTHAPVILDVAGTTLSADDRRRLRHPLTGGLILFTRNFESRAQLTALVAEMKAERPDLLVCVDHEGGRVQRFRGDGFTALPAMRRLGEAWDTDPAAAGNAATAVGQVLAGELRACGVDLSFAPVLDLDHGRCSAIGTRAFHRDPRAVTSLARSLTLGLLQAGMAHCGKHFPGHGGTEADSHVDAPQDPRPLAELLADDARPYTDLSASLTAVMPAHVIYPAVDARPAGFSARWLQDILRGQLGFAGAIFSDDLSMEAARRVPGVQGGATLSYTDAALLALQAGADLALLCNQSLGDGSAVDELLDGLTQAQANGRWQPDPASDGRRRALRPVTPAPGWDALQHDRRYQHARALIAALG